MPASSPERAAAAVLGACTLEDLPVPVEDLLARQGAQLVRNRFAGVEYAMVLRPAQGRPIIGINTNTHRARQRCATAHALGHLILHQQELIVCCTIRLPSHDGKPAMAAAAQESAANRFAAALLMPGALVPQALAAWLAGTQPDPAHFNRDPMVDALARTFAVSREMAIYRLADLGLASL